MGYGEFDPSRAARVRLMVAADVARKAGMRSRVISIQGVTTAADGSVGLRMRATAPAATALRRHKGRLAVLAEATSGDRRALATTTIRG